MKRVFGVLTASLAVVSAIVIVASCGVAKRGYSDSFDKRKNRDKVWVGISKNGMPDDKKANFAKCIHDAGAAVYFFPTYPENDSILNSYLDRVNCLIVPGSTSNDAPNRIETDMHIIRTAFDRQMPLLGICFGHQVISHSFGGDITRISKCFPESTIQHAIYDGDTNLGVRMEAHPISIDTTSILYSIYGTDSLGVNTSHRYCTFSVPDNLKVVAKAPDGVIEAYEATNIMGLQFHPEYMYGYMGLEKHLKIFKHLIQEGQKYRESQKTGWWSRDYNWYKSEKPVDTSFADVFYLVSTNIMRDTLYDGTVRYRASLTDTQKATLKQEISYMENRVFCDSLNFFSPYYHQYTMDAVGLTKDEFKDVEGPVADETYDAFCYYFDNLNGGRPFILAGFSQGAQLVKEIVKRMTPQQKEKMAAAYLLGWGLNDDDLKNPNIVPAKNAFDKGVTVSFNTVASLDGIWGAVMDDASVCINPLNWKTDATPATVKYHGQDVTVHLDPVNKVLIAEGFKKEPLPFVEPWPADCLHHYEIMFYNPFLNQNAKDRIYR